MRCRDRRLRICGVVDREGIESEAHQYPGSALKVVILEAGPGVQPNINGYMRSFYKASAKVPESPYPPALASAPSAVAAGRPTALMLSASNWNNPEHAYLDQKDSTLPFKSTYERLAGGTSHWMGLTPRLVPNDFRMSMYDKLRSRIGQSAMKR